MSFIRNLSIGIKVLIPPAILIAALGISSLLALYGMDRQRTALQSINTFALDRLTVVNRLVALSDRVQSDVFLISVLRFMNLPRSEIDPIQVRLDQGLNGMNVIYGQITTKWVLDPTERSFLERMRGPLDTFRMQAMEAAKIVSFDPFFGVLLVRSTAVSFAEFHNTLMEFKEYQEAQIALARAMSEKDASTIGSAIIAIAILVSLLGIFIAVVISTRLISRPIRNMTDLMRRLAGGECSINVHDLDLRDEIGAMSRAIDVFRQNAVEKARLDMELRESEERYRLLFHYSPAGVFHYDTQLCITDCNERLAFILQSAREKLVGLDMHILKDQRVLPALRQALAGRDGSYEGPYRATTSPADKWISLQTAPLFDREGKVDGGIGMAEDITERKQAEEERLWLERRLQQALKAESLARMAGAIAHHFNNLLGAVMGNLELAMLDFPQGSKSLANLAEAMAASRRAAELGRSMLAYLGQSVGERAPIRFSDICREALPQLTASLPESVRLKVDFPEDGPIIRADAVQIRQIMTNLVMNAGESTGSGAGEVVMTVQVVPAADIRAAKFNPPEWEPNDDHYLCLSVSDSGAGMDQQTLEKVFDPFFSTKFTGRGLGLAVVLGNVKAHEGAVTVESTRGRGSVFRVFLPVLLQEVQLPGKTEPDDTAAPKEQGLVTRRR